MMDIYLETKESQENRVNEIALTKKILVIIFISFFYLSLPKEIISAIHLGGKEKLFTVVMYFIR